MAEDAKGQSALADLRGLRCPLPVLKTAKRLASLAAGDLLEVLTDDPLAAIDIPLFCRQEDQILFERRSEDDGSTRFLIRRGAEPPRLDKNER